MLVLDQGTKTIWLFKFVEDQFIKNPNFLSIPFPGRLQHTIQMTVNFIYVAAFFEHMIKHYNHMGKLLVIYGRKGGPLQFMMNPRLCGVDATDSV